MWYLYVFCRSINEANIKITHDKVIYLLYIYRHILFIKIKNSNMFTNLKHKLICVGKIFKLINNINKFRYQNIS